MMKNKNSWWLESLGYILFGFTFGLIAIGSDWYMNQHFLIRIIIAIVFFVGLDFIIDARIKKYLSKTNEGKKK